MSDAREVRSFISWNLFSLNVLSIWILDKHHNSVPGNVTMFFNHNDGMLHHIMGLELLVHFRTWTVLSWYKTLH